jgi:hypothetical protein
VLNFAGFRRSVYQPSQLSSPWGKYNGLLALRSAIENDFGSMIKSPGYYLNEPRVFMSSKSQNIGRDSTNAVNYMFLTAEELGSPHIEYVPHFYAAARIDFCDVRTGFRETINLSKALEICSDDMELAWAIGKIREVDPGRVISRAPENARFRRRLDFVDKSFISKMENQFVQYLLRSFSARVYRNYALNIYSLPGESQDEFVNRCKELYGESIRHDLDMLHDVFNRRLEQIRQKYLSPGNSEEIEQARVESHDKNVFSRASEKIDDLFVRIGCDTSPNLDSSYRARKMRELEEQLFSLELEAQYEIHKLLSSYGEKAQTIDEYIIHPNLKDIHFVRSCILWMPVKAG